MENIYFLTSNEKKAKDFSQSGIKIKNFDSIHPEILSPDVETVVLHKARDVGCNNIIVEDTSLEIEDADFFGTEIKHVYENISSNIKFNNKKAIWKVSLCLKKDNHFYIATGSLKGKLKYPVCETGYHFDTIFAIQKKDKWVHFEKLTEEDKFNFGPRFKAINKLIKAIETNDFSKLKVISEDKVKDWVGKYQIETVAKKLKF